MARRKRRCIHGKLKNPVGRRVCKLKPTRRRRRYASKKSSVAAERAHELALIAAAKRSLGRYRRHRR